VTVPFEVAFRPAEGGDVGYIVTGWLESFHDANPEARLVRFARYKNPMRRRIKEILETAHVLMACDPADPDHLYGFICFEKIGLAPVIHYVYVSQLRRSVGLARGLATEALRILGGSAWAEYTHHTYVGGRIATAHGIEFNPFAAWKKP
jgi:hypothetical protein